MSLNTAYFLLQKKYSKTMSIQNVKLLMGLILVDHKNYYYIMCYLSIYNSLILAHSKYELLQYNLRAMPLQYQQNLKTIIQLKQSECMQMKHKIINYLQLLLQQPIMNVEGQTRKELLSLQKYICKSSTEPNMDLLNYIYEN